METKDYVGDGITVHWEPAICQHSENCFRRLPAVFDPKGRPWIDVGGATADAIAATVDTCPSRALTYTRTDGAALGPNGVAATPMVAIGRRDTAAVDAAPLDGETSVTVRYRLNGPLVLSGPVDVEAPDGTVEHHDEVFLCRCGGSGNKPFCDGTHKRIEFEATGVEPVSRRR